MNAIASERAVVAGPPEPGRLAGLTDRVAAVAAEHLDRTDRDAVFPVEALDEMRRTGLLGLLVPVEYGGLGGGLRDMIEACVSLGRVDLSVAMIFSMHCQQVAAVVEHGDERLRTELLPRIADGKIYVASV
ncbi:acyl-CoA dehydrogenase family protein, partial [Streptomyces griseoruber]